MTRRTFIKGMGALALIPFVPGMLKPEPTKVYGVSPAYDMRENMAKIAEVLSKHNAIIQDIQ